MSFAQLNARLKRLEAQKAAQDTAPPTDEELQAYAHGQPVRQHVQHLLERFQAYGEELHRLTRGTGAPGR